MVSSAQDFENRIRSSRRKQRLDDLHKKAKRILGKKADKKKRHHARIVIDAPRKGNPFKAKSIFKW